MCRERRGGSSWVWPCTFTTPAGTSAKGMWVNASGGIGVDGQRRADVVEAVDAQHAGAGEVMVADNEVLRPAPAHANGLPGVLADGLAHGEVADEQQQVVISHGPRPVSCTGQHSSPQRPETADSRSE